MTIIDTHIHLDDARYEEDLEDVIERAKEGGIKYFIIPGADAKTLPRAIEIAQKYEAVFFAVGVHPYDLDSFNEELFHRYLNHPKCVAVGECGLDYFRLEGSEEEKLAIKEKQKELFIKQIALAKEYKKPLIVHVRDASHDARVVLQEQNSSEVGGVLHCFNADEELLTLAKDNFYFGIGGVITFKNAKKLVNVLPKIPLERVIIETDGPYLTPEPFRGTRNEPFYTTFVVKKVADLLSLSADEVADLTTKNALKLFQIQ